MTLSTKCDLKTGVRGHSRSLKMAAFDRPHTTSYWSAIVNVALSCSPNLETGWCQHMKVTMSVSKTPQIQSSFRTEQRSIHQSISVVQFQLFNLRSTTTLNCSMKAWWTCSITGELHRSLFLNCSYDGITGVTCILHFNSTIVLSVVQMRCCCIYAASTTVWLCGRIADFGTEGSTVRTVFTLKLHQWGAVLPKHQRCGLVIAVGVLVNSVTNN